MTPRPLRLVLGALLLVATVAPVSAVAAGTYSGTWTGKTKQSEDIKFKVNKNDVVTFVKVGYEIPECGVTGVTTLRNQSAKITNGKFTVKYESSTGDIKFKGTMTSATKANGTLYASFTPAFGCQGATNTKWNASK